MTLGPGIFIMQCRELAGGGLGKNCFAEFYFRILFETFITHLSRVEVSKRDSRGQKVQSSFINMDQDLLTFLTLLGKMRSLLKFEYILNGLRYISLDSDRLRL